MARYQGAIIQNDQILLVLHREHAGGRSYWLLPGGGREANEEEEACVAREMKEETDLDVQVERLLMEAPAHPQGHPGQRKTYLCRILGGEARPGYEPEPEASAVYGIAEIGWFDLRDESGWNEQVKADPYTYPELKQLQQILGYV